MMKNIKSRSMEKGPHNMQNLLIHSLVYRTPVYLPSLQDVTGFEHVLML